MGTFIWTFVYWDGWTNIALPSGKYLSRFLCLIVCLSSFIKCLGQLSLLNSLLSTHLHETHPVTFDECVEKAHLELEMSAFKTQGQCKLNWERQSRALLMSLFYFSRLSFTLLVIILTKNIARGLSWLVSSANTCAYNMAGHQVAPLSLVQNLATRWRHLHCFQI